jgi:hypothetical protein
MRMSPNVAREVAAMRRMTVPELREKYADAFGEATTCRHKGYLQKRIVWRLQANAEGGLSERARLRARELAAGADVRLTAPVSKDAPPPERTRVARLALPQDGRLPMPGAVITREYKGDTIEVRVLPHGFEYLGEVYRTLSAVAKAVTGTHWNGYHFFRLGRKDADGQD